MRTEGEKQVWTARARIRYIALQCLPMEKNILDLIFLNEVSSIVLQQGLRHLR